ncbi:MAG: glycosyltransferase family 4 protein, partial [Candidatus Muiribacteriota bacterium]
KIKKNNLEKNFHITGWVDDITDYLKLFDIGVLTSKWEGFGLVLAEYMAAKKPVVATRVDGIEDVVVHNESGFLVESENLEDFTNTILTLLENESLRNKFVSNGFERVRKKFSIERVVKEHIELYKEILRKI